MTVDVELGDRGLVVAGAAVPVRVTLESDRARTVDVAVDWDFGRRSYRSELPAAAPVELDLSLPVQTQGAGQVNVEVSDASGSLGQRAVPFEVDSGSTLVGIGTSLASSGAPEQTPTVGGIQEARLVELVDESWSRPGWLGSLSAVVLGAADIDGLSESEVSQLRSWVWRGGDLVVDTARSTDLPVVDLPAADASRTAVGSGWVRFSDGAAALGEWSTVVEPGVQRSELTNSMGMWFAGDGLMSPGLVDIEFLSVWVVVLAVFGSALIAGPGLWFVLRSRPRRRWMWVAAPGVSLLVAGLLITLGQGVFTRSEVRASSTLVVDPWRGSGSVSMGLKASESLALPPGAELIAASPSALVADTGAGSTATVDIARNSFGTLGVSPVDLEEGPSISVTAVANAAGSVDVTVTNGSGSDLVGVVVRGSGRVRSFGDVPAGESVTLPFEVAAEIDVLQPMFTSSMPGDMPMGDMAFDGDGRFVGGAPPFGQFDIATVTLPTSRGVVVVTGSLEGDITALGRTLPGLSQVVALASVLGDSPTGAALRIDAVGPAAPTDPLDDGFDEPAPAAPDAVERFTQYVRFSSVGGRPASGCGLHTMANDLQLWTGAEWAPAAPLGEPVISERLSGAAGATVRHAGHPPGGHGPGEDVGAAPDRHAVALRLRRGGLMNDSVPALLVRGLSKTYGSHLALNSVSLDVPAGAVCGLIGPNGAGKSTLMSVVATLLRPSGGHVEVFGTPVTDVRSVRRLVGYVPDVLGMYSGISVEEYLRFFATAYGVGAERRDALVDGLLELVDLGNQTRRRREHLVAGHEAAHRTRPRSRPRSEAADPRRTGERTRPPARIELRDIISHLRSLGVTIMISSHILGELRRCAPTPPCSNAARWSGTRT